MIITETAVSRLKRYNDIRVLQVLRTEMLTPRMKRVIVGGDEIEGFGRGPNIKLVIPPPGAAEPEWPLKGPNGGAIWPDHPRRPAVRTYSVSAFDARSGELSIDFVLHGRNGPAANWASRAKPGDQLGVGGPGGRTLRESDWYLFVGDQSALPAIANMLSGLPPSARGRAIIEIPNRDERQPISHPLNLEITWLYRDASASAGERTEALQDCASNAWWPTGANAFVWAGGESEIIRAVRSHFRQERKMTPRQLLAIGYWRRGMTEDDYKKAFNNDRDEDYFKGAF